jgi:hypothetical protein
LAGDRLGDALDAASGLNWFKSVSFDRGVKVWRFSDGR